MNSEYFFNKNSLDVPWIESPFFYKILNNSNYSEEEKKILIDYHEKGYLIIDLSLSDTIINSVVSDMYKALENEKTNEVPFRNRNRQVDKQYS